MRILDLFCCGGGAAMGLHQAFPDAEIVGVDIAAHPRYPFNFVQSDALTYPLEGFDYVWASPPCQAFTTAQRIRNNAHPDLIAPIRARLSATGKPYTIENVPGAPLRNAVELCGAMFGLRTYRHRIFECSFEVEAPEHPKHTARTAKMGRPVQPGEYMHVVGNFSGVELAREIMAAPWLTRDELREAIPPAYSRYIGEKLKETL